MREAKELAEEPGESVEHDDRDDHGSQDHCADESEEADIPAAAGLLLATTKRTLLCIAAQGFKAMTFPNNFCSESIFEALD